jgi:hypothetical protein
MARVSGKTMVMSIENNGIPCYSAAWNKKETKIKEREGSSLLSSKEPAKWGLMGWALANTMVESVEHNSVLHYSAIGKRGIVVTCYSSPRNGKEMEINCSAAKNQPNEN